MISEKNKLRLETLSAQAFALSMCLYGNSGDSLRAMRVTDQDNVLWLLSDLLHEMNEIIQGGV